MSVIIATVNGGAPVIGTAPIIITGSGFEITQGLFGFLAPDAYYPFSINIWEDTLIVATPPGGMPDGIQYVPAVTLAAESPPQPLKTGAFNNVLSPSSGGVDYSTTPGSPILYTEAQQFVASRVGVTDTWGFTTTNAFASGPKVFIVSSTNWTGIGASTRLAWNVTEWPLKKFNGADLAEGDLLPYIPYEVVQVFPPAASPYYALITVGVDASKQNAGDFRYPGVKDGTTATQLNITDTGAPGTGAFSGFPWVLRFTQDPTGGGVTCSSATRLKLGTVAGTINIKRQNGSDLQPGDISTTYETMTLIKHTDPGGSQYRLQGAGVSGGSTSNPFAVVVNNPATSVTGSTCYLYRNGLDTSNDQSGATANATGVANSVVVALGAITGGVITSLNIKAPKMAVSQVTVGAAPTVDVIFYEMSGLGWTSFGAVSVPVAAADISLVKPNNDASGTTMINAKSSGLSIAVPDDKLWGCIIAPSSTDNNKINMIGRVTMTIQGTLT